MLIWVFVVVIVAFLSYLADVGVLAILRQPVPFLEGSIISVVLMVTCIVMLLRIARMSKYGEKEMLREWVSELEKELEKARQESDHAKKLLSASEEKDDKTGKDPESA